VELMNKYETVFIVNPSVEDAGVKALIQKFSDLINSDGKSRKTQKVIM
jgi:ribosomal protein S6